MNKGNVDELDDLLTSDIVRHSPQSPDLEGIKAVKQEVINLQSAFPNRHEVIDELTIEGNTSVVRMRPTATIHSNSIWKSSNIINVLDSSLDRG
jgi:hypothetical protein